MKLHNSVIGALAVAATALAATTATAAGERPMFTRFPSAVKAPASTLTNWTFKWTYQNGNYSARFVGTNPKQGAVSTTVPTYVFPVSLTCGTTTYSALDVDALSQSGATVLADTLASPIFQSEVDFKSGGVDLGTTQYIDAYTQADVWGAGVKKHLGYHVLLGAPTTETLISKTIPANDCSVTTDFGVKNINANINWFDSNVIQPALTANHIPTNAFAIFVTTQTYLTSGGCCIGGYHSESNGGVTYAHFTFIQKAGAFSQDVSALTHEVGEWQLDPFVNNTSSPCGGLLENGDPLEGTANYGGYPYKVGTFTYNLQDLVTLPYFGAPPRTSAGKEFTFQGTHLLVCQNGQ